MMSRASIFASLTRLGAVLPGWLPFARQAGSVPGIPRGYAGGLFWTVVGGSYSAEGIADAYGYDLHAVCGAIDPDGRDLSAALAHRADAKAGDKPLAWAVLSAQNGAWVAAYELADGRWWTVAAVDGTLLPGRACDKFHESEASCKNALEAQIADLRESGRSDILAFTTRSLGLDCEEIPDTIEAALRRAALARKRAAKDTGRRTPVVRLRHTRSSEALKRRLRQVAVVAGLALAAWWAWSKFYDAERMAAAVAPPPPPPPPPPWQAPVMRLEARSWAALCQSALDGTKREIAGWQIENGECIDQNEVIVRWRRRVAMEPFNGAGSFERQWAQSLPPAGASVVFVNGGEIAVVRRAFATPSAVAPLPKVVPELSGGRIQADFWAAAHLQGGRADIRARAQAPGLPGARTIYFSHGFAAVSQPGWTASAWAEHFAMPGMTIKSATWIARDAVWQFAGEVYERN